MALKYVNTTVLVTDPKTKIDIAEIELLSGSRELFEVTFLSGPRADEVEVMSGIVSISNYLAQYHQMMRPGGEFDIH